MKWARMERRQKERVVRASEDGFPIWLRKVRVMERVIAQVGDIKGLIKTTSKTKRRSCNFAFPMGFHHMACDSGIQRYPPACRFGFLI